MDHQPGRHHRPLGLVHLRRQAAGLRPRAGRRHPGVVRGERRPSSSGRCTSSTREDGEVKGSFVQPRPQSAHRELHVAQLQRRADVQGLLRRLRQLRDGHLGVRLLEPRRPSQQIAYADPAEYSPAPRTPADRGQLVDALLQRPHLRVRHPPRRDHLEPRPRLDAPRAPGRPVQPADPDGVVRAGSRGRGDHDRGRRSRAQQFKQGRRTDGQLLVRGLRLRRRVVRRPRGQRRRARHEQRSACTSSRSRRPTSAGNVTTKSVTYMVNSADFPGGVSGYGPGHARAQPRRGAELRRVRAGRRARVHGDRRPGT